MKRQYSFQQVTPSGSILKKTGILGNLDEKPKICFS